MKLTREDYQYNHRIERQHRIDDFPKQVKILIGAGLLIGVTGGFIVLLMVCRVLYMHH